MGRFGSADGIPIGAKVKDLRIAEDTVTVDFSNEVLAGLDESSLKTMFKQVNHTLRQFGFGKSVRLTCRDKLLCDYLPPQHRASSRLRRPLPQQQRRSHCRQEPHYPATV